MCPYPVDLPIRGFRSDCFPNFTFGRILYEIIEIMDKPVEVGPVPKMNDSGTDICFL
jgi:hypothetical protein